LKNTTTGLILLVTCLKKKWITWIFLSIKLTLINGWILAT
jgi:hypothetical protein